MIPCWSYSSRTMRSPWRRRREAARSQAAVNRTGDAAPVQIAHVARNACLGELAGELTALDDAVVPVDAAGQNHRRPDDAPAVEGGGPGGHGLIQVAEFGGGEGEEERSGVVGRLTLRGSRLAGGRPHR